MGCASPSVAGYKSDVSADFTVPDAYIRHIRDGLQRKDGSVTDVPTKAKPVGMYTLDREDMEWLRQHRTFGATGNPQYRITEDVFERMIYIMDHASSEGNDRLATLEDIQEAFVKRLNMRNPSDDESGIVRDAMEQIFAYWQSKRKKLKRPLCRMFWPATQADDPDPHEVFRPREKTGYKLRKHHVKSNGSLYNLERKRCNWKHI